mgnify:CR=1 FL=1
MSDGNMQQYLDQLATMKEEVETMDPAFLSAWHDLRDQGGKEGALSAKTKALICLGIGVVLHCDFCIASHVKALLQLGATRQELIEVGFVGVKMGGGPALGYVARIIEACDEFGTR